MPATSRFALVKGSQVISLKLLVHALRYIECDAVRYNVYGMKDALLRLAVDPANNQHPLAMYNTFDLGRNKDDDDIVIFRSAHFTGHDIEDFPMYLEVGKGFGTVRLPVQWRGQESKLKGYPQSVHSMRASSGKGFGFPPTTNQTARNRWVRLRNVYQTLMRTQLRTGYRLEVSVQAPSLHAAMEFVSNSPLLNVQTYITPFPHMAAQRIHHWRVTQKEVRHHARSVFQAASVLEFIRGSNKNKCPARVKQIIIDLQNALGDNALGRKTTWADPTAWWCNITRPDEGIPLRSPSPTDSYYELPDNPEGPGILVLQIAHFTMYQMRAFWQHHKDLIPCYVCCEVKVVRVTGGDKQFRVRCSRCRFEKGLQHAREHWQACIDQHFFEVDKDKYFEIVQMRERRRKRHYVLEEIEDAETVSSDRESGSKSEESEQPPKQIANPTLRGPTRIRTRNQVLTYPNQAEPFQILRPTKRRRQNGASQLENQQQQNQQAENLQEINQQEENAGQESEGETPSETASVYRFTEDQIGEHHAICVAGMLFSGRVTEPATIIRLARGLCATTNKFIQPNGNCQFQAIGFHQYKNKTSTTAARKRICNWLEQHPETIADFLVSSDREMDVDTYLANMRKPQQWGDEMTLMAASHAYDRPIAVLKQTDQGALVWSYYPNEEQGAYAGLFLHSNHYEILFAR